MVRVFNDENPVLIKTKQLDSYLANMVTLIKFAHYDAEITEI